MELHSHFTYCKGTKRLHFMKAIKSFEEIWHHAFQALKVMDALVHNWLHLSSLIPLPSLPFIPFPTMLPLSLALSPSSSLAHVYTQYTYIYTYPRHSRPFSLPSLSFPSHPLSSLSVPSYKIKYESIIHSFKHICHRHVQHRAPYLQSLCLLLFQLFTTRTVPSEKTPEHWGSVF